MRKLLKILNVFIFLYNYLNYQAYYWPVPLGKPGTYDFSKDIRYF